MNCKQNFAFDIPDLTAHHHRRENASSGRFRGQVPEAISYQLLHFR